MSTLRQRARDMFRSKDEKVLIEAGITYPSGAVTKEGRKLVCDYLVANDENVKAYLVKVAEEVCSENKKKK